MKSSMGTIGGKTKAKRDVNGAEYGGYKMKLLSQVLTAL